MNYIKINQTGIVVGSGICRQEDLNLIPLAPGEILVPNMLPPPSTNTVCRFVNGQVIDTHQPNLASHSWMIWDDVNFCWIDGRNLEDHKTSKWEEIKTARSAAEYSGFVWDGSLFDSDLVSQQKIMGAAQLAVLNQSFTVEWTLADNNVRTLNSSEMTAVGVSLGNHVEEQYLIARNLREQITSAQSIEQVDAIIWPTTHQ